MRSLVVEDDYITSQVMKEILSAYGHTDIAENGRIAIELFTDAINNEEMYDIIFLDIMMPELDGQETLSIIRQKEVENRIMGLDAVKVIMTTALDDFENIKNAFKSQCEGYLVKPVEKDKIVGILREYNFVD